MISPHEKPPPNEKKLRFVSFAVHATRGLLRDQNARRKAMFGIVLGALVMLSGGATLLAPILNPHERPGWFIFYWLVCAWVTVTALLLAVLDLLLVRIQARATRRALARKVTPPETGDDAD